jgi:hypothetical protein
MLEYPSINTLIMLNNNTPMLPPHIIEDMLLLYLVQAFYHYIMSDNPIVHVSTFYGKSTWEWHIIRDDWQTTGVADKMLLNYCGQTIVIKNETLSEGSATPW